VEIFISCTWMRPYRRTVCYELHRTFVWSIIVDGSRDGKTLIVKRSRLIRSGISERGGRANDFVSYNRSHFSTQKLLKRYRKLTFAEHNIV
jgi:hypothetical protein